MKKLIWLITFSMLILSSPILLADINDWEGTFVIVTDGQGSMLTIKHTSQIISISCPGFSANIEEFIFPAGPFVLCKDGGKLAASTEGMLKLNMTIDDFTNQMKKLGEIFLKISIKRGPTYPKSDL